MPHPIFPSSTPTFQSKTDLPALVPYMFTAFWEWGAVHVFPLSASPPLSPNLQAPLTEASKTGEEGRKGRNKTEHFYSTGMIESWLCLCNVITDTVYVGVCTCTRVSFRESSEVYDCTACEVSNASNSSVSYASLSSGFLAGKHIKLSKSTQQSHFL